MKLKDALKLKEAQNDKKEYQKKFKAVMKKYNIDNITDLDDDKKDDFFDDVDDAHVSDDEEKS
tara:strand:+ start:1157 stop:1345 length:189 start_codon:yes stop_codon:yes gene_type:complete